MAGDLAFGVAGSRHRLLAATHERQMSELIKHNLDAILILDADGNIEFANPTVESLLGETAAQLQGTPLGLTLGLDEANEIELLSRNSDGVQEPRSAELRLVSLGSTEEVKTLAFLHDITARKKSEYLATRIGRILEHSWNEIYVFSTDTLRFIDVSLSAQQHLGYSIDELRQMTPTDLKPEFSFVQYQTLLEPLRAELEQEIHFEAEQRRKDGSVYPVEVRLQLSTEECPPVFIAIAQDISNRRHYIAELEHKALYDALTDLPNRALLHDRLDQVLKIEHRETVPLAILSVSILRLDEINDLLGYQHSDQVLQEVSRRLLKVCRDSDTVARLGDDEFVIILNNATLESAQTVAREIQNSLELPVNIADFLLEIEATVGIALYPGHGDDTHALL